MTFPIPKINILGLNKNELQLIEKMFLKQLDEHHLFGDEKLLLEKIQAHQKVSQCILYVIECKNGKLYTGITSDMERRYEEHKSGRGAKFTRVYGVKELLYCKVYNSRSLAMRAEKEMKKLSHWKKLERISQ